MSLWKKKKDKKKHGNFCKNWHCQNFFCCPKNLSCLKFGRRRGEGLTASQLPRPVRLWVLSPVSSIKHIKVSVKFDIIETGLQFVPSLKCRQNLTHHLMTSLSLTCGICKCLYYFRMDTITWIPKSSQGQMNIISQTISNFFSQYFSFDPSR